MKVRIPIMIMLVILLYSGKINAQIWIYSSMVRFGNTVYYPVDSLSVNRLRGTSVVWERNMTDRYFDISLKSDSIGVLIKDSLVYFKQKYRKAPKNYQEITFYKKRNLISPKIEITFLKE
jgi:hypothetical protein